jgi:hypothetical protein
MVYPQGTWFDVGLGACGHTSVNSDFIVALPASNYDGGSHCGDVCALLMFGGSVKLTTCVFRKSKLRPTGNPSMQLLRIFVLRALKAL